MSKITLIGENYIEVKKYDFLYCCYDGGESIKIVYKINISAGDEVHFFYFKPFPKKVDNSKYIAICMGINECINKSAGNVNHSDYIFDASKTE